MQNEDLLSVAAKQQEELKIKDEQLIKLEEKL